MEVLKLVVKIETEQQMELLQMRIPANMAGRFMVFIGQELEAIATQAQRVSKVNDIK